MVPFTNMGNIQQTATGGQGDGIKLGFLVFLHVMSKASDDTDQENKFGGLA